MAEESRLGMGRRGFLAAVGSLAAAPLLSGMPTRASAQAAGSDSSAAAQVSGQRKLGTLEVSSVGLGVQNMSRKYDTTVPYLPEMIPIIRAAYDSGVRFFDTAEAYGPFECERILGEAIAPFRDKVVITSKFGWNIDPDTGKRARDSTASPTTSRAPSRGRSGDSEPIALIFSTSTASTRQ